jgi:hypothetical protein
MRTLAASIDRAHLTISMKEVKPLIYYSRSIITSSRERYFYSYEQISRRDSTVSDV